MMNGFTLTFAMMLLFAAPAFAGVELSWGACKGSVGWQADITFPCGSADGSPKATRFGWAAAPSNEP